jgi:hypothetical protein
LGLSTPLPSPVPVKIYVQPTGLRYLGILLFRLVKVVIITTLILVILLLVPFGVRYLLADSINSLEEIRDGIAKLKEEHDEGVVQEQITAEAAAAALVTLRNSLVEPSPVRQRPRQRQRSATPLRNIKPDQD